MALLEPKQPSRVQLEAEAVAHAAWLRWDETHKGHTAAPLVATMCKCGHRAVVHDETGCLTYDDGEGGRVRRCLCERYDRYVP